MFKKLFFLSSSLVLLAGCATPKTVNKDNIVGSWKCDYSFQQGQNDVTVHSNEVFRLDGTASTLGVIRTTPIAGETPQEYSFSGEALWQINGDLLTLNVVDMQTMESNKTSFEGNNIHNMFKSESKEEYQILTLTNDKLTLRHQMRDFVYHCSKNE
ncbi:hypothetical protein [Vibrio marisflavi]|uniref:Lipocalin-like domain-containing protein n=1 Tax=Vibrio marisflavi CECT 7928 TaxID=634439 RepID=A0ABN8DZ20_9VIBR|nr:hypothetical protein [Vibrio marisflavi]CAH0536928.1 hypothetical protein VMF7928_00818 [Vibrio marisflavi CECT 7928]